MVTGCPRDRPGRSLERSRRAIGIDLDGLLNPHDTVVGAPGLRDVLNGSSRFRGARGAGRPAAHSNPA